MALDQIQVSATSGLSPVFLIWDISGKVWHKGLSVFQTYIDANRGNYEISMTEQGSGAHYNGTFDSAIVAGDYILEIWDESDAELGSPSLLSAGTVGWTGAALIFAKQVAEEVWEAKRTDHANPVNFGGGIISESMNAQAKLDINAEADTALSDIGATSARMTNLDDLDQAITTAESNIRGGAETLETLSETNGAVRSGTAQAGSNTTITLDSGASSTDDIYNGDTIILVSATGVNQSRIIVDYNGTTKVATISSVWITNPDVTTKFIISGLGSSNVESLKTSGIAVANMLELYAKGTFVATVNDVSPTAGEFDGDSTLSTTNDRYNDQILVLSNGEARQISDYIGSTRTFKFLGAVGQMDRPFTSAPTNGETFSILGIAGF